VDFGSINDPSMAASASICQYGCQKAVRKLQRCASLGRQRNDITLEKGKMPNQVAYWILFYTANSGINACCTHVHEYVAIIVTFHRSKIARKEDASKADKATTSQ
jgi:hypothetical protein